MGVEIRAILSDEIKQKLNQLEELLKLGFIQQTEYQFRKDELLTDPLVLFIHKNENLTVPKFVKSDGLVYDDMNYSYSFHTEICAQEEQHEEKEETQLSIEIPDITASIELISSEDEEEYVIYGEEELPIASITDEQYESSQHKRYGILNYSQLPKVERFIKPNRSRTRIQSNKIVEQNEESSSDCSWVQASKLPKQIVLPPWGRPGKPTHFLSLKIKNLVPFRNYQKILKTKYHWASRFLIQPVKFHVTLGVLDLSRPGTMPVAIKAVQSFAEQLKWEEPLKLAFSGIGQFGNCILHAKVSNSQDIRDIATRIHSILQNHRLVGKTATFEPHVTLFKVRERFQDSKTSNLVVECANGKEKDLFFGEEEFSQLDLCAMEEVDDDGYYKRLASVVFVNNNK